MSTLFVMPSHVLQSRLISGEMHINAEPREQRRCLNNQEAPLPNGKLGTASEGFSQHKRIRIGEA